MKLLTKLRIPLVNNIYDIIWDDLYERTDLQTESFLILHTNAGIFDQLKAPERSI